MTAYMPDRIEVAKTTEKDPYWQYVRGICIICVVLIHAKNGAGYENEINYSWFFDYWLIMRQLSISP